MIGMRRLPRSLVVCVLISLAGMTLQVAGDAQVADALWRTTADAPSAASEAGHDLSGFDDLSSCSAASGSRSPRLSPGAFVPAWRAWPRSW